MFRKMLSDGNIRHFAYAPPATQLDDLSRERRPNPPYPNAPREHCSVFYYWWAFLRENADYIKCCAENGAGPMAELYLDFGDIRGENFFSWWRKTGREIFCERDGLALQIHHDIPYQHDFETALLVSIPLAINTEVALRELDVTLRKILRAQRDATPEAPVPKILPKRSIHTKPVLETLYERLRAWQLSQKYERDGKRVLHPDLADELGIVVSPDAVKNGINIRTYKSTVVSRLLKEARYLIANAGEGRFPDLSVPLKERAAKETRKRASDENRAKQPDQLATSKMAPRGRYN